MNNASLSSYYASPYGTTASLYGINPNIGTNSKRTNQEQAASTRFYDMTVHAVSQSTGGLRTESVEEVKTPSLESMLKTKYPGLAYHVFDASTSYWRSRNDYPHYMLYDQNCDTSILENWQPSGENPFYGSIDGQFIAPKEIHALGNVPPGSKAVVIHPDVQKRMEEDPEYAYEIMATIDNWFAYDVARNESIMPGSTVGMCQAVAIGKDGTIVNAAASNSSHGSITQSSDEMVQAYYRRRKKRAEYMHWLDLYLMEKDQIKNSISRKDMFKAE